MPNLELLQAIGEVLAVLTGKHRTELQHYPQTTHRIPIRLGDATDEIGRITAQMERLPGQSCFNPKSAI